MCVLSDGKNILLKKNLDQEEFGRNKNENENTWNGKKRKTLFYPVTMKKFFFLFVCRTSSMNKLFKIIASICHSIIIFFFFQTREKKNYFTIRQVFLFVFFVLFISIYRARFHDMKHRSTFCFDSLYHTKLWYRNEEKKILKQQQ